MGASVSPALAIFMVEKSLLKISGDSRVETATFAEKNVDEPHKKII